MRVRFWGTRGSIATPGPGTNYFGGNTSCVELTTSDGDLLIFDCGTGAHRLALELMGQGKKPIKSNILIGHTHWDHIQGFPFFSPAFVKENSVAIYGPEGSRGSLHEVLAGQMEFTYFPIALNQLPASISYHELSDVNAGENMHRRAGVKIHHGRRQSALGKTLLSSSINETGFPVPTWHRPAAARSVGDGRSGATRSTATMASTGPSP